MEPNLSRVWPDWEIVEPISKGAFGRVYKAVCKKKNDFAAVKIISLPQNMEEISAKRFEFSDETIRSFYRDQAEDVLAEIKIMKELVGSSNIVGIQDYEMVEKSGGIGYDIYIRMELLQSMEKHHADLELAHNFAQYILPEEEIIKIGSDICRGLEICHNVTTETKKRIIHRDIKPANILYHKNSDSYKLGDFGVSRELEGTDSNLTCSIGTRNYMAPEVINSRQYDCRADIYSLGLVLYYLANKKRLPFVNEAGRYKEEIDAYEDRVSGKPLPFPEYASEELAKVILKACSFKPEDRYASAKEFRLALEAVTAKPLPEQNPSDNPVVKNPMPPVGEFGPKKRKHKKILMLSVIAVVLVAGLLSVIIFSKDQAQSPATQEGITSGSASATGQTELTDTGLVGITKETATPVVTGELYEIKTESENYQSNWEHWFRLETSSDISNYFITLCGSDPSYSVSCEILNGNLDEITSGWSRDQETELGIYLDSATDYWLRITGDKKVESYRFVMEEENCDAGKSRKTALPIRLNTEYDKSIAVDGEEDWYAFTTSDHEAVYRIFVNPKVNGASIYGQTKLFLYDADGIKQESLFLDYETSGYIDIYLPPQTNYTLKILAENTVPAIGDYILSISEKVIDAGIDQNTAKELEIGVPYTGRLDSSLSDWYVFNFENEGRYVLDFHNIDTGCQVYVCGSSGVSFYESVRNEDSDSQEFFVEAGEKLYLEVKSSGKKDADLPNGTYILSVTAKEVI